MTALRDNETDRVEVRKLLFFWVWENGDQTSRTPWYVRKWRGRWGCNRWSEWIGEPGVCVCGGGTCREEDRISRNRFIIIIHLLCYWENSIKQEKQISPPPLFFFSCGLKCLVLREDLIRLQNVLKAFKLKLMVWGSQKDWCNVVNHNKMISFSSCYKILHAYIKMYLPS